VKTQSYSPDDLKEVEASEKRFTATYHHMPHDQGKEHLNKKFNICMNLDIFSKYQNRNHKNRNDKIN